MLAYISFVPPDLIEAARHVSPIGHSKLDRKLSNFDGI